MKVTPMHSQKIVVRVPRGTLTLSLAEAEQLLKDLQEVVGRTAELQQHLLPVHTSKAYITHESIYAFFSQIYENPAELRNHAGKLHGRLTAGAQSRLIHLDVRCRACHETTPRSSRGFDRCCKADALVDRSHLEIGVASLLLLKTDAFKKVGAVGSSVLNDFALLKSHIVPTA